VGAEAFGYAQTSSEEVCVVNSLGIRIAEPRSRAQVLTVMMGQGGGTGYAEQVAVDISAIDASAIGREAAERTSAMRDPVELPAGEYPVVLDHYAVVDLADWLGYLGFSALAVEEDRSFFEPGKRVASALVNVSDDATDAAGTPASFDYEGVPTQRVSLLEAGVCREVVHDNQTAFRAGRPSTGHGLPAPNPWGPLPLHMSIGGGETPRDELVRGLERGLLVTRFWYTNVVSPKQVVVTGMTRDGLFLVEDGRISAPVRNLRFTQDYLAALSGVEAVSRERRALEGFLGTTLVPALRLASFSFTGTTQH
jgi:predicted Zn-dependent protease